MWTLDKKILKANNNMLVRPGKAAMLDERTLLPHLCLDAKLKLRIRYGNAVRVLPNRVQYASGSIGRGGLLLVAFWGKDLEVEYELTMKKSIATCRSIVPVDIGR